MKIKGILAALAAGILLLTACTSLKNPFTSASAQTGSSDTAVTPAPWGADPAAMGMEMKLAAGTLQLEDTAQAVTPEEAKALLPLWKAVKTLSSSETVTQQEISALYSQIEETMTDEQVQAIEAMSLNPQDLAALMEKLGIDMPAMGNGPEGGQMLTDDQRATRQARIQSGASGGRGEGFVGGGPGGMAGGGLPEGGMVPPGGAFQGQDGTVQRTPQPGQNFGRRAGGMNLLFVDPLIQLLEARAAQAP